MPRLSILTVAKNSGFKLLDTFASLVSIPNFHRDELEWIIVDGFSLDVSLNALSIISNSGFPNIHILCEQDAGIYDAMNKAARLANSDYILFLNAGDRLAASSAVSMLRSKFDGYSIYAYGYCLRQKSLDLIFHPLAIKTHVQLILSYLCINLPTSHNSTLYPRFLVNEIPFNDYFDCAADFDQYLSMRARGTPISVNLSKSISIIDTEGFISVRRVASYKQYLAVSIKHKMHLSSLYWRLRLLLNRNCT